MISNVLRLPAGVSDITNNTLNRFIKHTLTPVALYLFLMPRGEMLQSVTLSIFLTHTTLGTFPLARYAGCELLCCSH
jgi:hypothetical protein